MVKCSKCGADNEKGAKFCEECGEKIREDRTEHHEKKKKRTNLILIISIIIGVVVILAIIIFSFPLIFKKPVDVLGTGEKEEDRPMIAGQEVESCEDECSSDFCTGLDYTECLMESDGCKDKNFKGKVPGKCDVECTTDNNCDPNEECKNYKCLVKEEQVNCNKPLIVSGTGCCLDWNDNRICDMEERLYNDGNHINLDFLEGSPPIAVTDEGTYPFDVKVKLNNKGNYNLEKVTIYLKGVNPKDFNQKYSDMIIQVGTLKPYESKIFTFSNFNYINKISANAEFVIRASIVYRYSGIPYEVHKDANFLVKKLN